MPPSEKGNNKGVEVMDNKAKAKRLGLVALRSLTLSSTSMPRAFSSSVYAQM